MVIHGYCWLCMVIHGYLFIKLDKGLEDLSMLTTCNKDTGEKKRQQQWTRGVWFCVSSGGHIQMWQPLYKYVKI